MEVNYFQILPDSCHILSSTRLYADMHFANKKLKKTNIIGTGDVRVKCLMNIILNAL